MYIYLSLILIIIYIVITVVFGVVGGNIAESKGIKRISGILLGVFLGIIGIIILVCLPEYENKQDKLPKDNNSTYEKITELKKLKDDNLITEQEFENHKNDILNNLRN